MNTDAKKLVLLVICLFGVFLMVRDGLDGPKYEDCGTVEKKMTVPYGKGEANLMMLVRFQKSGPKAIEVDATTYMKYEPGDRVCFNLRDESAETRTAWLGIYKLASAVIIFFWGIFLFVNQYAKD